MEVSLSLFHSFFQGWGKGVAFVNEFNLGRYWPSAGPQKNLYLPGPLLKLGNNKVTSIHINTIAFYIIYTFHLMFYIMIWFFFCCLLKWFFFNTFQILLFEMQSSGHSVELKEQSVWIE